MDPSVFGNNYYLVITNTKKKKSSKYLKEKQKIKKCNFPKNENNKICFKDEECKDNLAIKEVKEIRHKKKKGSDINEKKKIEDKDKKVVTHRILKDNLFVLNNYKYIRLNN